jgi:serine/threonine protein kinase
MGNKQTKLHSSRSLGALQDNLVTSNSRHGRVYDISGNLGKGLKKAQLKKYTKTEQTTGGVAIKLFNGQSKSNTDFKKEAAILSMCDHPSIVKLFEMTKVNNRMSLVLELCDGGSVLDRLPYVESQARKIVKQVCSAISYMHRKNIVHRDIECSNIMFSSSREDSEVKLVDFGSAIELQTVPNHPGAFKFLREKTGSLNVMAPEVIRGKYGPKADMWSRGVVAYTLLNNGEGPFKGTTK